MRLHSAWPIFAAGLATLLGLVSAAEPTVAEPATQISGPIRHENIAVYLIRGASAPGPVPQTLQEALAKGTVVVHETGNVQNLEIENKGAEPIFVQFGDIVKGGQQDRVLTVSMLLEPASGRVPIGAYCVEQGRWSARGKEDVKRFALSESLMPSRQAKVAIAKSLKPVAAAPSANEPSTGTSTSTVQSAETREQLPLNRIQRGRPADGESNGQGEVWRNVAKVQQDLSAKLSAPVASETSRTSLQLALENKTLQKAQTDYIAALDPEVLKPDDVVGVVIAVNGRLSSADVYPSNGLFRKMWPKIARAAATEALATDAGNASAPAPTDPVASPQAAPTVEAVTAFLADAEGGKTAERKLGSTATIETRDADKALRVEARTAKGLFVHRNYLAK